MKKANLFISMGLLIFGTILFLSHNTEVSDYTLGLLMGIAVGLELVGLVLVKYDTTKLTEWKKNLFGKLR